MFLKKPYEKPMLAIEHYALTQRIATCTVKFGLNDSDCVWKDSDATPNMFKLALSGYFVDGICAENAFGMDGTDSICYHTSGSSDPSSGTKVAFTS